MNVGQLIDALLAYPSDRKVVLKKDAEGNGYSPLASVQEAIYTATCSWAGEVHPTHEQVQESILSGERYGYTIEDFWDGDGEQVVLLGPVN